MHDDFETENEKQIRGKTVVAKLLWKAKVKKKKRKRKLSGNPRFYVSYSKLRRLSFYGTTSLS